VTLTASDYTLLLHKEQWLLKVEEIPVESAHGHYSVQLVCSRKYFPLG